MQDNNDIELKSAIADVLNDLVKINNDRIEGYGKAIAEMDDEEGYGLKKLFGEMIAQSVTFKTDLEAIVKMYDGEIAEGSLFTGKLYRAWMGIKSFITGGGKRTLLNSCDTGETAVAKAYDDALNDEVLTGDIRSLVERQRSILQKSHLVIKELVYKVTSSSNET